MKFYDSKLAPNPRRVRMFLAEKGVAVPTVEINIREGENLKPEFLRINSRGTLPVLELDDGTTIDESIAICRYIEELHPEPSLMGNGPLDKAVVESWQRHMEFDGLLPMSEVFRNSFPGFSARGIPGVIDPVPAIPALVERGTASLHRFYARLEQRLAETPFVAGERYTIADITALCAVDAATRYLNLPIGDAQGNCRRWHKTVSSRPSATL